jgi:hypothetical protein
VKLNNSRKDDARDYLKREAAELAAKAARGECISADQVDAVDRLARLIEIRDRVPPLRRPWWAAGAFGGSLVIVSVLLFAHVRETEIELDLMVSELRFVLAEEQVVSSALRVNALGVSGLHQIRIPSAIHPGDEDVLTDDRNRGAVSISLPGESKPAGTVVLAPVILPAGTNVGIRTAGSQAKYVLSLQPVEQEFRVNVEGGISVAVSGSPTKSFQFGSPRPILLKADKGDVDLALSLPSVSQSFIASELLVKDLSFARVDEFINPSRTLVRRVSTILNGTLFLESLNGEKHQLRPGEEIQLEESNGQIRLLRLENGQIRLRYYGRVRAMTTSSGEAYRSLMPTYLEWMRARHGLSLFWGTTLYLASLIASALRWWGVRI